MGKSVVNRFEGVFLLAKGEPLMFRCSDCGIDFLCYQCLEDGSFNSNTLRHGYLNYHVTSIRIPKNCNFNVDK